MFGKIQLPELLLPTALDKYLEDGWFRMGQSIFNCNVLHFNKQFYSAIWLRHNLSKYQDDSTFKKLQKLNAKFTVRIQPASITSEKEFLYAKYKTGIAFDTAESLTDLLLIPDLPSIYNTQEVCIYEEDKLIAVGFFDLGGIAAAGIVSFYDPDYKKYSLGKYLIYHKVAYCHRMGYQYFYPGYFAPNYALFDYKLSIGPTFLEFLNILTAQWQSYITFAAPHILIDELEHKMLLLQKMFYAHGIHISKYKYEYYNANYIPHLKGLELFDYPIFMFITCNKFQDFAPILVYDVLLEKYRVLRCIGYPCQASPAKEGYYNSNLLKIQEELFASENLEAVVSFFSEVD